MRSMRRTLLALAAAASTVLAAAVPAAAMGSGNPYLDQQTGVTYTVYQPTYGAGLRLQHAGGNAVCPAGTEQNLLTVYGKRSERQFTITQGNPMCSDVGEGTPVLRTTVRGARATVSAYCDPALERPCTRDDVRRFGGIIAMTLPAAPGLRPTTVWIETFSAHNLSAQQLVRIARSLQPVG